MLIPTEKEMGWKIDRQALDTKSSGNSSKDNTQSNWITKANTQYLRENEINTCIQYTGTSGKICSENCSQFLKEVYHMRCNTTKQKQCMYDEIAYKSHLLH